MPGSVVQTTLCVACPLHSACAIRLDMAGYEVVWERIMKRLVDIVLASVALVLLAIPLLIVMGLVRWKLGSPVFFRQTRAGLDGKPFQVIKFRTMTDARGPDGELLSDAERITPFGWVIRRTSVDELPELWCVLRGEMSLVGPRPLPTFYIPLYSTDQARRLRVLPGITGWAQVNGRNSLSWEDKFRLDVWYVDHQSLWLDVRILWRTLGVVFATEDISAEGEVSATRFCGSGSTPEAAPRAPAHAD